MGIITRGDITVALLAALQELYTEAEAAQERPQRFFDALESENTSLLLRYSIRKGDFARGGDASAKIKRALLRIGASPQLARRVAIATYEAEVNLIIHTVDGGLILADIQPSEITVVAQDSGPGIPDVDLARQPGYSTATPEVREMGFGAGMGLVNIERCTDKMSLWSAVSRRRNAAADDVQSLAGRDRRDRYRELISRSGALQCRPDHGRSQVI